MPDIVVGGNGHRGGVRLPAAAGCSVKTGWPASVRSGGQTPEVRGLAAADLNGDGRVEVVATTTNTSPTGAQVFVFNASGKLFQPKGGHQPAWPRYNRLPGRATTCTSTRSATTATARTARTSPSGTSTTTPTWRSSPPSTTTRSTPSTSTAPRSSPRRGSPTRESGAARPADGLGAVHPVGRPARRAAPLPPAQRARGRARPASPGCSGPRRRPSVADLDGDGRNEVIGIPNVERHIPYRTQGYAFMVLDGAYGDGQPLGAASPGLREAPDVQPSGLPTRRRLVPAQRHPRPDRGRPRRRRAGPRSSPRFPAARSTPWGRTVTGSGPPSTHRGARRRSPRRWSRPT